MSKHTPGPWEDNYRFTRASKFLEVTGNDEFGCEVARLNLHVGQSVAEANARLIAAAPKLLSAAKLVRQAWANHSLDAEDLSGWYEAIEAIRTAANKAEGAEE